MICFAKIALITSLMTTAFVSATPRPTTRPTRSPTPRPTPRPTRRPTDTAPDTTKYSTKGYNAYASAYFPDLGCEFLYSSSFDTGVYSTKSKFISIESTAFTLECKDIEELYLYFTTSSCDETTVTYLYGNLYDANSASKSSTFKIDGLTLLEASLEGLEVPVYENTCEYVCNEVCYPELLGYGTCPEDELPYLECYTTECSIEEYVGNAAVSVSWKAPPDKKSTQLEHSSSVVRSFGKENYYMSKSKGLFRSELDVTVTAILDGIDLFPSQTNSTYTGLTRTNSKEVSKSSNEEKYFRRMELLNNWK